MKSLIASAVLSVCALTSHATPQIPPGIIGGGGGIGNNNVGGVGVGSASATSAASASASATGTGGSATITGITGVSGGVWGGTGGSASAGISLGAGASLGGGGGVDLRGASIGSPTVPRQTPPAYAPPAAAPLVSCRLIFGFGGAGTGGSLSTGLPLGNDGICLQIRQFAVMDLMNERALLVNGGKMPFTMKDYFTVACRIEGMSELEGCKGVGTLSREQTRDPNLLP